MRAYEILTKQELNELLNPQNPQQRQRIYIVQPDAVKAAQRVRKVKTKYATSSARQEPTEIEKVLGMWQARDLQKQANARQATAQSRARRV